MHTYQEKSENGWEEGKIRRKWEMWSENGWEEGKRDIVYYLFRNKNKCHTFPKKK